MRTNVLDIAQMQPYDVSQDGLSWPRVVAVGLDESRD